MKNKITTLEIKNFKSIRHLEIECKKINLFIGKPNVGKSNILEGLSLLGANYSHTHEKYLSDLIRYEKIENLFYDQETGNRVEVLTDIGVAYLTYHYNINYYDLILANNPDVLSYIESERSIHDIMEDFQRYLTQYPIDKDLTEPLYVYFTENGKRLEPSEGNLLSAANPVKKYEFKKLEKYDSRYHFFLLPPDGKNLYTIVQRNKHLYKELNSFFKEYDLKLVLNKKESTLQIQKEIDGIVYSYPYFTIADTLQRIIFHLMAIECNSDSVLLFEEPESHSFPTYIRMLAEKIIEDERNQYFINTHSPFILNTIIENADMKDVAVFVTTYEDFETKVKPLSQKEIKNMLDYGADIFFNLK